MSFIENILVTTDAGVVDEPRLLFTAPWEPVVVRRGDALGLRALADQFAEVVAPGLSNRVRDGRWVTILAWCLVKSHAVFHASGKRSVETRAVQRERYAWLRPLELIWVARTIALAKEDWRDRSLGGQRRVRRWYEDDMQSTDRFGMSVDQFRAYRQTGMYGGYRLAFRKWLGMTVLGDGWTPAQATIELAKWLDGKLGVARPSRSLHVGDGDEDSPSARSAKLGRGEEHRWWLRQWKTFDQGGRSADENTLPRRKNDFTILPEADRLKPLVFGSDQAGRRRTEVAREMAKVSAASHIEVCEHLSRVFAGNRTIALIPGFSRLADAGMAAMDLVAESLRSKPLVTVAEVGGLPTAVRICEDLMRAAQEWRKVAEMQIRHIETAHRFANCIPNGHPIECLSAVLHHHEIYGGGLRWFVLRNGRVELRSPPGSSSSRYRFRLWPLCRLATQCGVLRKMPHSLLIDTEAEEDETSENADE